MKQSSTEVFDCEKAFRLSAVLLLILTASFKAYSLISGLRILAQSDPVFQTLTIKDVLVYASLLEFICAVSLLSLRGALRFVPLLVFCIGAISYRVQLVVDGIPYYCPCFGVNNSPLFRTLFSPYLSGILLLYLSTGAGLFFALSLRAQTTQTI
jgi:hypothetical protein